MPPSTTTTITPPTIDGPAPADTSPRSLGEMVLGAAARYRGVALEYRRDGRTVSITYPELGVRARAIACGLIEIGVAPGDRVAIFAETSAQWTLADYGALCAGAVVVPIYHTSSPEECAYVLHNSGSRVVFCGDLDQAAKVAAVRDRCPTVEHVIVFEDGASESITLDELCEHGERVSVEAVEDALETRTRDDIATLVYTSGTTGPPKGCMLTHANILDSATVYIDELGINESHALYQFLPLAHVLARVAQTVVIQAGARACFWSGDTTKIIDELAELRPTHFPAVPRIYEKIHGVVTGRVEDGSAIQRAIFNWAIHTGEQARASEREGKALGSLQDLRYRLADRLVLGKVRDTFGADLQLALVGAAAVAPELLRFFDACGVLVLEGYGLSESCAVATLNTPKAVRFGSVGRPLPGTEVVTAPDGELMLRGPSVFKGYYRDTEATEAAMTPDGWLHTGDLGRVTEDGFVMITGRKKDLIITSSGKNITPANIESELRETRCITEAVVFGDNRPYLVAMVTLDKDEIAKLAKRLGIEGEHADLARDPRVRAEIQRAVDEVNAKVARIEQIKRFEILDHELTQEAGEVTPTLKVKRAFVYEKYADVFAGLYENGASS